MNRKNQNHAKPVDITECWKTNTVDKKIYRRLEFREKTFRSRNQDGSNSHTYRSDSVVTLQITASRTVNNRSQQTKHSHYFKMTQLTLDQLNAISAAEFNTIFHNVIEHWPIAAATVYASKPFQSFAVLCDAFQQYIDKLSIDDQVQILRLHPHLAGKMAKEGRLTGESASEQKQAGLLDKLATLEASELQSLNEEYIARFAFPFVICVRETNKIQAILAGLRQRLQNTRSDEVAVAMAEVRKICRLRVEALLAL